LLAIPAAAQTLTQAAPNTTDQQGQNVPIEGAPGGPQVFGPQYYSQPTPAAAAAAPERTPAFVVTPTASIQGTFTDNVRLVNTGAQSDWITTPSGGLNVAGKTERAEIAGSYSVSGDIYAEHSDLNGYRQNLLTVDRFEPVKNAFSVELRGSVDQQEIAQTGPQSATLRSGLTNQTQVANASITPSYVERWGTWGVSTLSYTLNEVAYFNGGNNTTANNLNDSTQQTILASLASGDRFTRLTWSLAFSDDISRGTETHLDQQTAEADGEYRIDSTLRVPATVGYDNFSENQSGFSSTELSGVFWNTGIHLVPGPRTDLVLRYGRRYDKPYESGSLTYKILPNVQFKAVYNISVQTQQQTLASALAGVTTDANGNLVNPITGVGATPNQTNDNLVNSVYRARTFQFGVSGSHGLNSFALDGQLETRDFGVLQGSDRSETINGLIGRTVGPLTTVNLNVAASHSTSVATVLNQGSTFDLLTGVDFGYKLSDRTNFSFDVTRRHETGATKSDEDAFVARLSHKF